MFELTSKVLKVFEKHNLFNEGIELIGSWCFYLYQKHLGVENFPLRTLDVDFLIPNPFKGKEHSEFIDDLKELGFEHSFRNDGSLYLWNAELKIEFITEEKGRGSDNAIRVKKLGLSAIPLRYMGILIEKPILIVSDGVRICVPNPVNFCIHKLIIANLRRNQDKKLKDLQQGICIFKILDQNEFLMFYNKLPKAWKNKIIRVLHNYKEKLPLYYNEIEKLEFTLQNANKEKK